MDSRALVLASVAGIAGVGLLRARSGGSRAVAPALPIVSVLHAQDTRPCWDDDPVPAMDDLAWIGRISRNRPGGVRFVEVDLVQVSRPVRWARIVAWESGEIAEGRCADLLERMRETAGVGHAWSVMNSYLDPRLADRGLGRDGYLATLVFLAADGDMARVLFSNDGCGGAGSSEAALRVWNGLTRDFPHARDDRKHHERIVIAASFEHPLLRPRIEAFWKNKGRLPESAQPAMIRDAIAKNRKRSGSRQALSVAFPTAAAAQTAALAARDAVTATPAFREWFAGSEVVDAEGRPQVCYHGTRSAFTEFNESEVPYRGGLLAFFSTNPAFAGGYAGKTGSPRVYPVYLSIQDPFDFRKHWTLARNFYRETGGIQDNMEARRVLMGMSDTLHRPIEDVFDTRWSARDLTEEMFVDAVYSGRWDALEAPEFVEWLRQGGHDGIVLLEGGSVNYGIFEPTQVKSATGNVGAFDPEEASISANRRGGSASRGTARGGTPDLRRLDRRLYRALRDEKGEALGILDRDRALGGNAEWGQGGCAVLAKALLDVFPHAAPYAIVTEGRVQHFVVRLGDRYLDGDGVVTRETLLRRWEKEWGPIWRRQGRDIRACRLVQVRRVAVGDVSALVPARFSGRCQASVVNALAEYLRPRLLDGESR